MTPRMKDFLADTLGILGVVIVVAALACFVLGLGHLIIVKMSDEPLYYKLFVVAMLCVFAAIAVFFLGGASGLLSHSEGGEKDTGIGGGNDTA